MFSKMLKYDTQMRFAHTPRGTENAAVSKNLFDKKHP